jgi:hypothetical protein
MAIEIQNIFNCFFLWNVNLHYGNQGHTFCSLPFYDGD